MYLKAATLVKPNNKNLDMIVSTKTKKQKNVFYDLKKKNNYLVAMKI